MWSPERKVPRLKCLSCEHSFSCSNNLYKHYRTFTDHRPQPKPSLNCKEVACVASVPFQQKELRKPRGSWGKRLRERLQEDPLFLKNAFAHERGLLIGAAQSEWLTGDKFWSKIFLLSSSVTKAIVEDVEGFESCVEAERIGSRVLHWKGKKNCQCAISLTV